MPIEFLFKLVKFFHLDLPACQANLLNHLPFNYLPFLSIKKWQLTSCLVLFNLFIDTISRLHSGIMDYNKFYISIFSIFFEKFLETGFLYSSNN